jgi:hypothetical protein
VKSPSNYFRLKNSEEMSCRHVEPRLSPGRTSTVLAVAHSGETPARTWSEDRSGGEWNDFSQVPLAKVELSLNSEHCVKTMPNAPHVCSMHTSCPCRAVI